MIRTLTHPSVGLVTLLLSCFASLTGAAASVAAASSSLIYVTSYAGTITTLNYTAGVSLDPIFTNTGGCGNASWLTLDYSRAVLYCLDEDLSGPNGTLSSYTTNTDGSLTPLDKVETIWGPVAGVIFGKGDDGLAMAHYLGSGVTSYNITNPSTLQPTVSDVFTQPAPGPNPSRQDAPHPHEAILDPTRQFLIVPDLGADLVRIFKIDQRLLKFTQVAPLHAAPGSGPRHAVFFRNKAKTFMYLISELANSITGYEVSYHRNGTLGFEEFYLSGSHGLGVQVPAGAAAAEIAISPDSRFITISSRDEASLSIPNFDPANSTAIPSDPLITFEINQRNGNLTKIQEFPAGGLVPRQFSISNDGTKVGVGLQNDGRVVVINRDVETGLLTEFDAHVDIAGQITCVRFDEASYSPN